MDLNLRDPATEMNVVRGLHTSLISITKMADANYVTVFTKEGTKVYDGNTAKIVVSERAVLEGYRCKTSGLWRVPLKPREEIKMRIQSNCEKSVAS